jgi:glycosyltransferase involved in cell wall biosynthesis
MKFSIIIPMYNVEAYVLEALQSIEQQPTSDYEVIIINDESSDNSAQLCEEFIQGRANWQLQHQKNAGSAHARNAGLQIAQGDYILFLDPDDRFEPNAFNTIWQEIEAQNNPDVAFFTATHFDAESGEIIQHETFKKEYIGAMNLPKDRFIFLDQKFGVQYAVIWKNTFKRSFLQENAITFERGLFHQDCDFMFKVFPKLKTASISNEIIYNYRKNRAGSVMNTFKIKRLNDMIYIYTKHFNEYQKLGHNTKLPNQFCISVFDFISSNNGITLKEYHTITEKLTATKPILKLNTQRKYFPVKIMPNKLGIALQIAILKMLKK